MPFLLRKTQLPPIWSLFSNVVYGIPRSRRAFIIVRPLTPAPMMQIEGGLFLSRIMGLGLCNVSKDVARTILTAPCRAPPLAWRRTCEIAEFVDTIKR